MSRSLPWHGRRSRLWAALLLALVASTGCEIKRPKGAYVPLPLNEPEPEGDAAAETEDASVVAPPGTMDGGPPAPNGDGGGPTDSPLATLQGDYMVRFENVTEVQNQYLGLVEGETISYGVLRVVLDGEQLTTSEWLCSSESTQTAEDGTLSTTISDVVWNSLSPVPRELNVDLKSGSWSTTAGTRRQGWRESAPRMPTSPNDTPGDYLDPEGDGWGVTVTVDAKGTAGLLPFEARCAYQLASYATTRYVQGTLTDGLLAGAKVRVDASDVHAWDADRKAGASPCETSQINDAPKPTTTRDVVTLSRLPDWLEVTQDDPKPCPSPQAFRQALD